MVLILAFWSRWSLPHVTVMPASPSALSPLLPLLMEGGKEAQRSPARQGSQSCRALQLLWVQRQAESREGGREGTGVGRLDGKTDGGQRAITGQGL